MDACAHFYKNTLLLYFNYTTAFSRTEKICINWRIVVKVLRKNNIYYSAIRNWRYVRTRNTLHCTVIETNPIALTSNFAALSQCFFLQKHYNNTVLRLAIGLHLCCPVKKTKLLLFNSIIFGNFFGLKLSKSAITLLNIIQQIFLICISGTVIYSWYGKNSNGFEFITLKVINRENFRHIYPKIRRHCLNKTNKMKISVSF